MKHLYSTLLAIVLTALVTSAYSQGSYAVSNIPEELLKNAHAVVRLEEYTFMYESSSKASETVHRAVTIIKESALEKSIFNEPYSSLMKITDIEATVYDKNGKKIKRIKAEDIEDYAAISGGSLFDDNRIKHFDPKCTDYPFTIEYSYKRKYSTTFVFPDWTYFEGYNTSVEKATFKVVLPADYKFRYRELNMPIKMETKSESDYKVYIWSIDNVQAVVEEPLSPPAELWAPIVMTAPSHFEMEGYKGSMDSWQTFGTFGTSLLVGKDNISESTIEEVKKRLTDDMTDYEKISEVYKFVQQKNRYISIQVGIGGLQPFDAATVDKLSYGDCKALTNYTRTLLNRLGFTAYYTMVKASGVSLIDPSFADNNFNHVFLCIPTANDTLWLECTNSHNACGYIGHFTDDRYVLVTDGEQSKLVKTPAYTAEQNRQTVAGEIQLLDNLDATAEVIFSYTGGLFSEEFGLTLMDDKDRKKTITKEIDIPNFILTNYELTTDNGRHPKLDKKLLLDLPSYSSKMGDRWIVKLNTINKSTFVPPYSRGRKTPLFIQRNYSEIDSITLKLPQGMTIEALPEPVELNSEFGTYYAKATNTGGAISYERRLEVRKGTYSKEKFNDFRDFLERIAKADDASAMLKPLDL